VRGQAGEVAQVTVKLDAYVLERRRRTNVPPQAPRWQVAPPDARINERLECIRDARNARRPQATDGATNAQRKQPCHPGTIFPRVGTSRPYYPVG
jgi:hypothetical protein